MTLKQVKQLVAEQGAHLEAGVKYLDPNDGLEAQYAGRRTWHIVPFAGARQNDVICRETLAEVAAWCRGEEDEED